MPMKAQKPERIAFRHFDPFTDLVDRCDHRSDILTPNRRSIVPKGNLLFIPLWSLFELSILASEIVAKQKKRDAEKLGI
jgi:hypothetical protein